MQKNRNAKDRPSFARVGRNSEPFVEIIAKNLDKSCDTENKVKDYFNKYGTVTEVKLLKNSDGHSIGIAYVTFTQPYMALKACQSVNGRKNLFGKRIEVKKAITAKERMKDREKKETIGFWKVMAKNLDKEMDDKSLFQKFFIFGTILSHHVFRNQKGDSLGYGFVVFLTREAANRAIQRCRDIKWNSGNLKVEKFNSKNNWYRKEILRRMLVIEGSTDCHALRKLFGGYGSIESMEAVGNETQLIFKEQSAAKRALSHSRYFQSIRLRMAEHKDFVIEFICEICATKISIDSLLGFGCGHQYCKDCIKNCIEMSIKDRTFGQMCPQIGCTELADENLIRLVVSEQIFDKYKEMMRRKSEREQNIKFRKQNNFSDDLINKNYKRCPKCFVPIEKMDGCNHVKCLECYHDFCYNCFKDYPNDRYEDENIQYCQCDEP